MLPNSKKMLIRAAKNGYAIPAFNIHNLENMRACVEAAVELKSAVILSATPSTFRFSGMKNIVAIAKSLNSQYDIPVVLHMDHNHSFKQIQDGLNLGIRSVMFDGSSLPLKENMKWTRKVVQLASQYDATVEAELGVIPGVEDDIKISHHDEDRSCTDPESVVEFCSFTDVDSIAIAIGNAHGIYHSEPKLNIKRLGEVRDICDTPLVLHGGSGLSKAQIRQCIAGGVAKVNIGTELKPPYANSLREFFVSNPKQLDPRLFLEPAVEAIKELAKEKILICKSENKY